MATLPTLDDVKSYLRNEKPTEDNDEYTEALAAAVQTMRDECQRNFVVAPTDPLNYVTTSFVPDPRSDLLYIGDCTAVTVVVENGTTLTVGTHYQLEPAVTTNWAGLTEPYNALRRLDAWWYTNGRRPTVAVTRAPGFTAIPDRVVEGIKILAKDIIENRNVKLGLVAVTEQAGISARMNPVVRATIDAYRGVKSWGIA